MAVEDYRRKRQHISAFLLRHGRAYEAGTTWKGRHLRWLDGQSFAHAAQRFAFQEMLNAMRARLWNASTDWMQLSWRSCLPGRWHRWSRHSRPCVASSRNG